MPQTAHADPSQPPRGADEGRNTLEELRVTMSNPRMKNYQQAHSILEVTWRATDERVMFHMALKRYQASIRTLGQWIWNLLNGDRQK